MRLNSLKFFTIIFTALLAACALQKRTPSGAVPDLTIKSCGLIAFNETSRTALDNVDVLYTLQNDCNKDRKIGPEDGPILTAFEYDEVNPQQKKWLRNLHKRAVLEEKKASALPYVCVDYQAEADPCLTFKNVYGINPTFSSDQSRSQQEADLGSNDAK